MRSHATAPRGLSALAIAGAALATEFGMPAPAHAINFFVGDDDARAVVGSGKMVDVHRSVEAFSTLRIDGPLDVEARPGTRPGVTVHADDNIEPIVETVVEGDTLTVRLRHGSHLHTKGTLRVEVQFTQLAATKQLGSGDLTILDAKVPNLQSAIAGGGDLAIRHAQLGKLSVVVAGAGDVKVDGQAHEAKFSVAGSGDIAAADLVARKVAVRISGSGDARVQATESLEAGVSGSGEIAYRGHPRDVTRRVSGSGSIHAED